MNAIRWSVAGLFPGVLVADGAPVATAELDSTNGCQGSGSFR